MKIVFIALQIFSFTTLPAIVLGVLFKYMQMVVGSKSVASYSLIKYDSRGETKNNNYYTRIGNSTKV